MKKSLKALLAFIFMVTITAGCSTAPSESAVQEEPSSKQNLLHR